MANPTSNNGPAHGRYRNTVNAMFGDVRRAQEFPLGPQDTTAFGQARAALKYDYVTGAAGLAAENAMAKLQYKLARGTNRANYRAALGDVATNAAERGIIGSTAHQSGIQGAKAERDAANSEAMLGMLDTRLGNLNARSGLAGDFHMGMAELAMKKRAQKRNMALAAFGSGGSNPWGY